MKFGSNLAVVLSQPSTNLVVETHAPDTRRNSQNGCVTAKVCRSLTTCVAPANLRTSIFARGSGTVVVGVGVQERSTISTRLCSPSTRNTLKRH
jgi:hypothetical protein